MEEFAIFSGILVKLVVNELIDTVVLVICVVLRHQVCLCHSEGIDESAPFATYDMDALSATLSIVNSSIVECADVALRGIFTRWGTLHSVNLFD